MPLTKKLNFSSTQESLFKSENVNGQLQYLYKANDNSTDTEQEDAKRY